MDENNVVIGEPRGYRLVYTEPMADAAEGAQDLLDAGEEVGGEARDPTEEEQNQAEGEEPDVGEPGAQGQGGGYLPVDFVLIFNDLPPVVLPDKGAL